MTIATPNTEDHFEIVVEDLHKSFGTHPVLSGVNLKIRRGELVAIVGGSGCGKTVLLKTITGHFGADSGVQTLSTALTPAIAKICPLNVPR